MTTASAMATYCIHEAFLNAAKNESSELSSSSPEKSGITASFQSADDFLKSDPRSLLSKSSRDLLISESLGSLKPLSSLLTLLSGFLSALISLSRSTTSKLTVSYTDFFSVLSFCLVTLTLEAFLISFSFARIASLVPFLTRLLIFFLDASFSLIIILSGLVASKVDFENKSSPLESLENILSPLLTIPITA